MSSFKVIAYPNGINDQDLKLHANNVLTSLTGNANFPSPYEALTVIAAAISNLSIAIDAQKPGDVASTAAVHAKATEVKACLKVLAIYVWRKAGGDEAIALTSGFDISKPATKGIKTFNVKPGKLSGEADLETSSFGSAGYAWYKSTDPIGTWEVVTFTTVSKTTITGLTPGTKYWFKVEATKGNKVVYVSDPYFLMVV